jgi:hypothetical protein
MLSYSLVNIHCLPDIESVELFTVNDVNKEIHG